MPFAVGATYLYIDLNRSASTDMGAAESTPEGENQNAVGVPTTEPVSDSAPAAHKPNSNTKSSRHSRVRQATSAGPRHSVLDSPYDLIVQIRGAKRVGKSSLRRRLCGEEFDIDRYAPSVGTEEAIIDWVYCAQQGQHEMSVPVKIVDVVDIDGEGDALDPACVRRGDFLMPLRALQRQSRAP